MKGVEGMYSRKETTPLLPTRDNKIRRAISSAMKNARRYKPNYKLYKNER